MLPMFSCSFSTRVSNRNLVCTLLSTRGRLRAAGSLAEFAGGTPRGDRRRHAVSRRFGEGPQRAVLEPRHRHHHEVAGAHEGRAKLECSYAFVLHHLACWLDLSGIFSALSRLGALFVSTQHAVVFVIALVIPHQLCTPSTLLGFVLASAHCTLHLFRLSCRGHVSLTPLAPYLLRLSRLAPVSLTPLAPGPRVSYAVVFPCALSRKLFAFACRVGIMLVSRFASLLLADLRMQQHALLLMPWSFSWLDSTQDSSGPLGRIS